MALAVSVETLDSKTTEVRYKFSDSEFVLLRRYPEYYTILWPSKVGAYAFFIAAQNIKVTDSSAVVFLTSEGRNASFDTWDLAKVADKDPARFEEDCVFLRISLKSFDFAFQRLDTGVPAPSIFDSDGSFAVVGVTGSDPSDYALEEVVSLMEETATPYAGKESRTIIDRIETYLAEGREDG